MDDLSLAEIKIDRAIKIGSSYEDINEETLRTVFNCLINALKIMPNRSMEKDELLVYLEDICGLKFKQYGVVFRAETKKDPILIDKKMLTELIWRARSLLF